MDGLETRTLEPELQNLFNLPAVKVSGFQTFLKINNVNYGFFNLQYTFLTDLTSTFLTGGTRPAPAYPQPFCVQLWLERVCYNCMTTLPGQSATKQSTACSLAP
jgi:hypothetical protein